MIELKGKMPKKGEKLSRSAAKTMAVILATIIGVTGFTVESYAGDWWEKVKIKGDLRYRHEMLKDEGEDARHRHRVRARVGILGEVNDYTSVGVQYATGSDDPVSTNQTLDNGFSSKSVVLDLAYLKMKCRLVDGLVITAGKFKNPFYKPGKSELVWDSDWNPEGGALHYVHDMNDLSVDIRGAGLWIDERSSDADSWLGAGQAIFTQKFNEGETHISVGGSFYNYVNTVGYEPFWGDEAMGNSVDTNNVYLNDYQIIEAMVEVGHEFNDIPVTVMGDFVNNTGADSLNTGWLFGVHVGKAKELYSWSAQYIYRQVEKDAVLGLFTDSDFRGGGTDAKGHEIGGSFVTARNSTFNVTYFINTIGLEGDGAGFNRLQVDLQLKF